MKAYICSIGEKTTQLCCEQLKKYGFEVILLDEKESWHKKYIRFIELANETCIRIDADIIPNSNIKNILNEELGDTTMIQYGHYCLYKNLPSIGNPCLYTKEALDIIKMNVNFIHETRPETSAWRMDGVRQKAWTDDTIMGTHGFFQFKEDIERAKANKIDRKQEGQYDFDLVDKIMKL